MGRNSGKFSIAKAQPTFMMRSSSVAPMTNRPDKPKESTVADGLELPMAPAWFSEPPTGTMEDGIQLSLLALDQIKDRPEVFVERDRCRCDVEFKL